LTVFVDDLAVVSFLGHPGLRYNGSHFIDVHLVAPQSCSVFRLLLAPLLWLYN